MKFIQVFLFVFLASISSLQAQSAKPVIYYVGNMGVAIVKNDSVILIDALHDYYGVYYLPSDTAILTKLQKKEKPFLHLVAITATHVHDDHFDETLISRVNKLLPASKTVMGTQPAQKLTGIHKNSLSIINQQGTARISSNITISLKNVGHSGNRNQSIENYRIEITWGTFRFVHFGDAPSDEKAFDGLAPGADVAMVPYWLCFDEKDIQRMEKQKFKKIIAIHIDPRKSETFGKSTIEIIPFTHYGQKYSLK